MIASATVLPANGVEATPSSGARRSGPRPDVPAAPSFEHSLRDARSQRRDDGVREHGQRRQDDRSAERRPERSRHDVARPDDRQRPTDPGRAGRKDSSAVQEPTTPSAGTPPADGMSASTAATDPVPVASADGTPVSGPPSPAVVAPTAGAASVVTGQSAGVTVQAAGVTAVEATEGMVTRPATVGTATDTTDTVPSAPGSAAVSAPTTGSSGASGANAGPAAATVTTATASTSQAPALTTEPASPGPPGQGAGAPPAAADQGRTTGVMAPSTDPHASAMPMSVTAETVGASVVSAGPSVPAAKPTSPVDGGPTVAVTAAPPTMSTPPQATGAGPTPAPVTSVPAWMQQAVQAQLAGRLVAAARGGEPGTVQRLTLHLHPADLGTVQVVATLDDGTVSLQLMAGSAATRDALRASLGALRSDLAAAGLDGARLDVSDQPPGSQQGLAQHQAGASREGSSHRPTGGSQAATTAATGRPDRGPEPTAARAGVPQGVRADRGVDLHL